MDRILSVVLHIRRRRRISGLDKGALERRSNRDGASRDHHLPEEEDGVENVSRA
jgi:hypothetical protein